MMHKTLLTLPLIAASDGAMIVVKSSNVSQYLGVLALLTSVTAITFILVLVACGMRDPIEY